MVGGNREESEYATSISQKPPNEMYLYLKPRHIPSRRRTATAAGPIRAETVS